TDIPAPSLAEMTAYHGAPGRMVSGQFLPRADRGAVVCALSGAERAVKRAMLNEYRSQRTVIAHLTDGLKAFATRRTTIFYDLRTRERFTTNNSAGRFPGQSGAVRQSLPRRYSRINRISVMPYAVDGASGRLSAGASELRCSGRRRANRC